MTIEILDLVEQNNTLLENIKSEVNHIYEIMVTEMSKSFTTFADFYGCARVAGTPLPDAITLPATGSKSGDSPNTSFTIDTPNSWSLQAGNNYGNDGNSANISLVANDDYQLAQCDLASVLFNGTTSANGSYGSAYLNPMNTLPHGLAAGDITYTGPFGTGKTEPPIGLTASTVALDGYQYNASATTITCTPYNVTLVNDDVRIAKNHLNGVITSTLVTPDQIKFDLWNILECTSVANDGTVVFDILDESDNVVMANVINGQDISSIVVSKAKVRATLTRPTVSSISPVVSLMKLRWFETK